LRHVALIVEMLAEVTATIDGSLRQDERERMAPTAGCKKNPEDRRQHQLAALSGRIRKM
jgi:hypothetical protein